MNYINFEAGGNAYKLRLNVRNTVALEKQLGCNPLTIFGSGDTMPTLTNMVYILHASLQALEHNITLDKAYSIFDSWLEEGHTVLDFLPIIIDIYKVSGIISNEKPQENEKN